MDDTAIYYSRFIEVLNYPIFNRCQEIGMLIDKLSTKQLQDIFPILIQSIFGWNGGTGWGFRTITRPTNPHEYDTLYHFFVPLGPMFRLCYRLLNDAQKFEIPISLIPEKMRQMLETGRYPAFYSDIIKIDPFERRINSLALNAFDFYMLNFAIHGTIPIHKEYSAALTIQNDKLKSLYFFLAADYLCSFLPSDPEAVVLPQNICSTKSSQIMPVQHVQPPTRSPKYLSMSAISHFSPSNNPATRSPDLPRQFAWRSESVLYLFIDTWLRFECDVLGDLPSNEFMRVVRILVKQIHAFGNSAELDHTSMASLRKIAQPMLNSRMYIFLRTIMSRWPLDSSFSVVLELWLSYIQPWRYTYNRNISIMMDVPISTKHENFILENIVCYTQIYVQLLSRFLSLDLTSYRNCSMVYRMLKVFGQSNLSDILRSYEFSFSQNFGNTTANQSTLYNNTPRRHDTPIKGLSFRGNHSRGVNDIGASFRQDTYFLDDTYIPMFGDEIQDQVQNLIESLQEAALIVTEQIMILEQEIAEQFKGFFGWLRYWFSGWSGPNFGMWNMAERRKIPEILQICTFSLGKIFHIEITDFVPKHKYRNTSGNSTELFQNDVSGEMDISNPKNISPPAMKKRALLINYAGDPELIPVQRSECTFLVRFFYQLSCKINLMYGNEIKILWHKNSIKGKLGRQIFTAPQIVQIFDKSGGYSRLKEQYLGPRLSLRFLASYYNLVIIAASFGLGQCIFCSPILGFFILVTLSFIYLLISALMDNSIA